MSAQQIRKPPAGRGIPTARNIDHFALTVPDLAQAIDFFCDALGCEVVYRGGPYPDPEGWLTTTSGARTPSTLRLAMLRAGSRLNIELFEYDAANRSTVTPRDHDIGGHHLAFYVDDLDIAVAYLKAIPGVTVDGLTKVGPCQPNAGMRFVHFRAPWGQTMEVLSYPHGLAYEADTSARLVGPATAWDDE